MGRSTDSSRFSDRFVRLAIVGPDSLLRHHYLSEEGPGCLEMDGTALVVHRTLANERASGKMGGWAERMYLDQSDEGVFFNTKASTSRSKQHEDIDTDTPCQSAIQHLFVALLGQDGGMIEGI